MAETRLSVDDLVAPVFVKEGIDEPQPIPSMPGVLSAERAFLRQLGGGCDLPCGALAEDRPDGTVALEVLLATLDGKTVLRARHEGPDPETVGTEAALILLDEHGGRHLLEA